MSAVPPIVFSPYVGRVRAGKIAQRDKNSPPVQTKRAGSLETHRLLTEIADHPGFDLPAIRQSAAQQ